MSWAEDMSDSSSTTRTDVLRASPPMFDSRLLDALSRVHPLVPVLRSERVAASDAPGFADAETRRRVRDERLRQPGGREPGSEFGRYANFAGLSR